MIATTLIVTAGTVVTAAIAAPDKFNQLIHWHNQPSNSQPVSPPQQPSKEVTTSDTKAILERRQSQQRVNPIDSSKAETSGKAAANAKALADAKLADVEAKAAAKAKADEEAAVSVRAKADADARAAAKAKADEEERKISLEKANQFRTLVLTEIDQNHNGAPGNIDWSFEVKVNSVPLQSVSTHRFVGSERRVSVGPSQPIVWPPQSLAAAAKHTIEVSGRQMPGSLTVGGFSTFDDESTKLIHITVKSRHPPALGGAEFDFVFSLSHPSGPQAPK